MRATRCATAEAFAHLKSPQGRQLIKDKSVITLVACRNMWLSAQETMKSLIAEAGGQLRDHLAFSDQGHALATFVTTPRWVLTGRRDRFLGLPPAGSHRQSSPRTERARRASGIPRLVETHPRLRQNRPVAAAAHSPDIRLVSGHADTDGRSIKSVGTMVIFTPAETAT